jgi:hypothetical protein
MKTVLQEHSLDWALTHVSRYCDNDFFPAMFEFEALAASWDEVRMHLLAVDLNSHSPRPPVVRFAPKLNGAFRILHRLDPVDALIYTALVREIHEKICGSPGSLGTAALHPFRVEASADGSFFAARNSWQQHTERLETLAAKYQAAGPQETGGWVFMADIHDFFGNIQIRRLVQGLLKSGAIDADLGNAFGRFLSAICTGAGRGIPAGPGASRVLAELLFADIDQKILNHTPDFTRWGDDLRMFFRTREEAAAALEDLAAYLHAAHELRFASSKTRIVPVDEFCAHHFRRLPEESIDAGPAEIRLSGFVGQNPHALHYHWMSVQAPEPMNVHLTLQSLPEHQEVGRVYTVHFNRAVEQNPPDLFSLRRILRKASAYRIDALLPGVLGSFDKLAPVVREMAIYLRSVLDKENVQSYAKEIRTAWERRLHSSSYLNEWMADVFTNPAFNEIDVPAHYSELVDIRSKALIARRKSDRDWVRRHAAQLDAFDLWDRRAVLFACSILPEGERAEVARKALARGGITERAVARQIDPGSASPYVAPGQAIRGPDNYPSYGDKAFKEPDAEAGRRHQAELPDNYPAYGTKAVRPSPQWLNERIPELDALLRRHGPEIAVSIQDSIDSGNCMSGTEAFRKEVTARLNLASDTRGVPASALLSFRDDPLTRRAARAAALRWKETEGGKS